MLQGRGMQAGSTHLLACRVSSRGLGGSGARCWPAALPKHPLQHIAHTLQRTCAAAIMSSMAVAAAAALMPSYHSRRLPSG